MLGVDVLTTPHLLQPPFRKPQPPVQPLHRRAVSTNTVYVLPMQLEGFVRISCTCIAVQSHAIHVAMKYAKTCLAIVRIGSVTVTTMNT